MTLPATPVILVFTLFSLSRTLPFTVRDKFTSTHTAVTIQKPLECIQCDARPLSCLCTTDTGSPWAATVASGTCTTGTGGDTTGTSHAIKCKGAAAIGARARPGCFAFRLPQARAVIAALPTACRLAFSIRATCLRDRTRSGQ